MQNNPNDDLSTTKVIGQINVYSQVEPTHQEAGAGRKCIYTDHVFEVSWKHLALVYTTSLLAEEAWRRPRSNASSRNVRQHWYSASVCSTWLIFNVQAPPSPGLGNTLRPFSPWCQIMVLQGRCSCAPKIDPWSPPYPRRMCAASESKLALT